MCIPQVILQTRFSNDGPLTKLGSSLRIVKLAALHISFRRASSSGPLQLRLHQDPAHEAHLETLPGSSARLLVPHLDGCRWVPPKPTAFPKNGLPARSTNRSLERSLGGPPGIRTRTTGLKVQCEYNGGVAFQDPPSPILARCAGSETCRLVNGGKTYPVPFSSSSFSARWSTTCLQD